MSMAPLYGMVNARTATRALILLQVAVVAVGVWLDLSYEEALLHKELLEIKEAYIASYDSRWMFATGAVLALYVVSLAGLFFMAVWARWLYTACWLVATLHPLADWALISINADVLMVPGAIFEVLTGATLAVIWLNVWPSGRSAEAGPAGVGSPR